MHTHTCTHTGRHTDTHTHQTDTHPPTHTPPHTQTHTESKMSFDELYWPSVQQLSKQSFPGNNNKIKTSLVKYIYVQILM